MLLHDGGGNRTPTVKALPMIIDGAAGPRLPDRSVHELLGKTMPR